MRNIARGLLEDLKQKHGQADIPQTIVHDNASYVVTPTHNRLNLTFDAGLQEGGFRSWIGDQSESAAGLVKRFGDVSP